MENSAKRLEYIDIAKGLGILAIVWAHSKGVLDIYFITICVPLFFLISGFLFNRDDSFKRFFKKKFVSLYIPFLVCNLIYPLFITYHRINLGLPIEENIRYLAMIVLTLKKDGFLFGATWFLSNLFLISSFYKLLYQKIKNSWVLVLIFSGISIFASICSLNIVDDVRRMLILCVFYSFGVLIRDKQCYIEKNFKYWVIPLFIIFVSVCSYLTFNHSVLFLYKRTNLISYVQFVLLSLFGSILIILFSKVLCRTRFLVKTLSYIGKSSIYILLWHFVFFEIFSAILLLNSSIPLIYLDSMPHVITQSALGSFLYFVIGVLGSLFMVFVTSFLKKIVEYGYSMIK